MNLLSSHKQTLKIANTYALKNMLNRKLAMPHFALFDLDNTLLIGDSDYAWGEYLCKHKVVDPVSFQKQNHDFYQDYVKGEMDSEAYYRFCLAPLVDNDEASMKALRARYISEVVEGMISKQARALVDFHLSKGDVCVIITATQTFVVEPIAELFGVKHLIGTVPEYIDGKYTGKVEGTICIKEGKLVKFKQWMEQHGYKEEEIEHITAYSDSINDLPLLNMAHTPVVVNPDPKLLAHANEQGWQVLHFQKDE